MATNPGLKSDSAVVSEKASGTLRKIQIKYSEDYRPFLAELIKRLGKKNSEQLVALKELVESVIQDLGKLSSGVLQSRTQSKFLKQVTTNIDLIESGLKSYRDSAKASDKSSEAIKKVEQKTDISFEGLLEDQKGIKESMKKTTPKGPGMMEKLKGIAPEPFAVGKDIGMGLAQATLGPFAGMATMAGKAGVSVAKALRDKMIARKEKKVSEALRPMSTGISKDVLEELAQLEKTGHPVAGVFKPGSMAGSTAAAAPSPAETVGSRAHPAATARISSARSRQAGGALPLSGKEPSSKEIARAARPIEYFFDKLADKAKWTHEVLKELKKISQGSGGGLLGGLMGGLAGLLPKLLPALAMLGAGGAAVGMGLIANKLDKILHQTNPKFAKRMDLFKAPGVLGMGLVRPIEGPKQMAKAYEDLTKQFMKKIGLPMDEYEKSVRQLAKSLGGLSMGPIKKFGDWFKGFFGVGDKNTEVSKTRPLVKAVARSAPAVLSSKAGSSPASEKKLDRKAQQGASVKDEKLIGLMEGLILRVEKLFEGSKVPTSAPSVSSMGKMSNDDVYNTRDPLLGSLNSGSLHLSG